jgi:hypothetical protein
MVISYSHHSVLIPFHIQPFRLSCVVLRLGRFVWNNSYVSINSMGAPPPRKFVGLLSFWGEKTLQNPHPWGLTLTQMPHPWGQNISFLRIFETKNRTQALSRINISAFNIDSVAISFRNVFN